MRLLIRWVAAAVALVVAAQVVPGIEIRDQSGWVAVFAMAAVLGLVNAFIRPLLTLLSCGLVVVTLGLFLFVINALTLWIASWVCVNWLNVGFYVDGFWPAFLGSLVISLVSFVLSLLLPDGGERSARVARA
jgi:putative membrane protein